MYFENIKDKPDELINQYYKIIEDIEILIKEYILETKDKDLLIRQRNDLQIQYDKLSHIQYFISPAHFPSDTKVKNMYNKEVNIQVFDNACKDWLNRVHLRYLYPIILRLSEFSERGARLRDFILFGLSIIISTLLGLGITWSFDRNNDYDLDETGKDIINKIDSSMMLLNERDKKIDSLTTLDFEYNHIIDSLTILTQKKCK